MSRPVKNKRLFGKKDASNPSDAVGKKIKKLKKEGKPQEQAEAIALSMKERGEI